MGSYWIEAGTESCLYCGRPYPIQEVSINRWKCYIGQRVSENWWCWIAEKWDNIRAYFFCCRWCCWRAVEDKQNRTGEWDWGEFGKDWW